MDIIDQMQHVLRNINGYKSKKRKIFKILSDNNILFFPLEYLKYSYSKGYIPYKNYSGVIFINNKSFLTLDMDHSVFYDKIFSLDREIFRAEITKYIKYGMNKNIKSNSLKQKILMEIIEEK